jgi:UDPglucose 6-dehydrogenase
MVKSNVTTVIPICIVAGESMKNQTPLEALTVGFAGMTHLGLNSAVATAERGFKIVCFDEQSSVINALQAKILPVVEPGLSELLEKNSDKIMFSNTQADLKSCDIVYIAADVPTNDKGQSDLRGIRALIDTVSLNLNPKAVLVILCQVPPGFTRSLSFAKERLYYQVETLVFGQAIHRALYPERFMIGSFTPSAPLVDSYQHLLNAFQCPCLVMRYESAELAKISINCCLVASVSVANTLSELCEKIGADWSEIVPALKLDKRIGAHAYLSAGLGIAGGNLERDLNTVLELSEAHGTESSVVKAWLSNSRYRRDWVLRTLQKQVFFGLPHPRLTVLGLAYKENTHSIKNSPAISLLNSLTKHQVQLYDPVVPGSVVPWASGKTTLQEALDGADVLIIMTPWDEFKQMTLEILKKSMRGTIIIDPYRVLTTYQESDFRSNGFQYLTLGATVTC